MISSLMAATQHKEVEMVETQNWESKWYLKETPGEKLSH